MRSIFRKMRWEFGKLGILPSNMTRRKLMRLNVFHLFLSVVSCLMLSNNSGALDFYNGSNFDRETVGTARPIGSFRPVLTVNIEMKFGEKHENEWLLNGLPLETSTYRSNMSCPKEGSCSGMLTVFGVATVASVIFLSSVRKK
jgi:hypothetical protein